MNLGQLLQKRPIGQRHARQGRALRPSGALGSRPPVNRWRNVTVLAPPNQRSRPLRRLVPPPQNEPRARGRRLRPAAWESSRLPPRSRFPNPQAPASGPQRLRRINPHDSPRRRNRPARRHLRHLARVVVVHVNFAVLPPREILGDAFQILPRDGKLLCPARPRSRHRQRNPNSPARRRLRQRRHKLERRCMTAGSSLALNFWLLTPDFWLLASQAPQSPPLSWRLHSLPLVKPL